MKKAVLLGVLLGVLISLVVIPTAFWIVRQRTQPLPIRQTVAQTQQLTPPAGIPEADWRDDGVWHTTPEYADVTNELLRIAKACDAFNNLTSNEVETLIENMHSPHYQARQLAVIAARGPYPGPVSAKLLPHVLGLLSDPVAGVRLFAVSSLEKLGSKDTIPFLNPLLNDSSPVVVKVAQRVISNLQQKEEPPPGK
jgi:hypothetical protein